MLLEAASFPKRWPRMCNFPKVLALVRRDPTGSYAAHSITLAPNVIPGMMFGISVAPLISGQPEVSG